ncbi:MFS transporter [Streptomyces sp. NPDC052109]|uniref:MFS transporter n=1 Tax=Streptomyces sp. NPDC052109 TaxID=3155527 RepID=UPI003436A437
MTTSPTEFRDAYDEAPARPAPAAHRAAAHDPAGRSPLVRWLSVLTLGLGVFAIVTSELLPVGLLPPIAKDVGVSNGVAGLTVTLYGAVAALTAVPLTALFSRIDRRWLITVLMAVLVAGNIVTALAPNYPVLIAARILMGFGHGVFWSTVPGTTVRLVPEKDGVKATAVVLSGISIASVLGVPLGTFLGQQTHWQVAFFAMAGLGALVLLGALTLLPSLPPQGRADLAALRGLLRHAPFMTALLVTSLTMIGHYLAFTYIAPYLEQETGLNSDLISVLLLVFGVAGVIGNFVAGATVARSLRKSLLTAIGAMTLALVVFSLLKDSEFVAYPVLIVWGLAYAALPLCLQTWVMQSAGDATDAASSMYITSFNASIALGSLFGGLTVDHIGLGSVTWIAAALAAAALVAAALGRQSTSSGS